MRLDSILLLGPTGSGKTPLGELLQERGAVGHRCHHFDFGQQLRGLAESRAAPAGFTAAQLEYVREVLAAGRLLEDRDFHIAERLLRGFLAARGAEVGDLVVLNGLPRHCGQARSLERVLDVRWVLCLECTAETVAGRIAANSGGDRSGRRDDRADAVACRIALFRERTAPLVEHYRTRGAKVGVWRVGLGSPAGEALPVIEELLGC